MVDKGGIMHRILVFCCVRVIFVVLVLIDGFSWAFIFLFKQRVFVHSPFLVRLLFSILLVLLLPNRNDFFSSFFSSFFLFSSFCFHESTHLHCEIDRITEH